MKCVVYGFVGLGLVVLTLTAPSQIAPAQAATSVVADWELNEPAGASVMSDSSGNGLDGVISSDAAAQGLTSNGSYYSWSSRCPACLPVQEGRVVRVADDDRLDIPDPTATYTLEFRFRTTHGYGNYMQKGQSTTNGGQIKVQGPGGTVQCLFKGADGTRVGTGSPTPLDDGEWHTVACVHTATQVKEFVDGVRVAVKNGSTGPINNKRSLTIGGKSNCDQVTITCDYFSGDIDYVKVTTEEPSSNLSPTAAFSSSCGATSCSFDSSDSTDPDGSIASYAWTLGDGGTSTQANPSHEYGTSGTREVTLTVTDNLGKTDGVTHSVNLVGTPPGKPLEATAQRGDSKATVAWVAPNSSGSDPITQYKVKSTPDAQRCTTSTLSCKVNGLTNGESYTFTVIAESDAGVGPPSDPTNSVRPAGEPGKVRHVKAQAGTRAARIDWDAADPNGSKVVKYRIVTSKGQHRTVEGTVDHVRFDLLKSHRSYKFRVRAVNKVGAGEWSKWTKSVRIH